MRRLSTVVPAAVLVALSLVAAAPGAVAADSPTTTAKAAQPTSQTPAVEVVKVSGMLDPVLADYLDRTVREAQHAKVRAIVLQVDSTSSVISAARVETLAHTLASSTIPIVAWIGPSGARAEGDMAQLVGVIGTVGIAPGSAIGRTGDLVVPPSLLTPAFRRHLGVLRDGLMNADEAARAGLTVPTEDALVLRRILLKVPGFRAKATATVPATPVQFTQLSTGANLMHSFASPSLAELFFAIGLCLLLFELFSAGAGVAGVSGAAFLLFGSYGLVVLPVRPISVALMVLSMIAFAIDVQVGVPRAWTAIGSVVFAVGITFLYHGIAIPWLATIGTTVLVVVTMYFGMPSMTRSRFSTPTIDREWLVGRMGTATEALAPDGFIRIGEAQWAGRAAGDSVAAGALVQVVAVEGVRCQVVPVTEPGVASAESASGD